MKHIIMYIILFLSFNALSNENLRDGIIAVQKVPIYSSLPEYGISSVLSGKYNMPEAQASLKYGAEITILEVYSLRVNSGKNIYYKILYKGLDVTMTGYVFSHNIDNSGNIGRTNISVH